MPLVSALFALSACTSSGPIRPVLDEGKRAAQTVAPEQVVPQVVTDRHPSSDSAPEFARPAMRPSPYEGLPAETYPENALPGYSSSPYGVNPIPESADVTEPAPYEPSTMGASPEPFDVAAIDAPSSPMSPALTPPPEPKIFTMTASPAVLALENDVEGNLKSGNYAEAAASLERAIRIQPKNPELWHVLAEVRLKQQQPGLAEDLAKKSNLLAKNNAELVRSNWNVIAKSRRLKGDSAGASEAMDRASQ